MTQCIISLRFSLSLSRIIGYGVARRLGKVRWLTRDSAILNISTRGHTLILNDGHWSIFILLSVRDYGWVTGGSSIQDSLTWLCITIIESSQVQLFLGLFHLSNDSC